jgi:hypothetical protein
MEMGSRKKKKTSGDSKVNSEKYFRDYFWNGTSIEQWVQFLKVTPSIHF